MKKQWLSQIPEETQIAEYAPADERKESCINFKVQEAGETSLPREKLTCLWVVWGVLLLGFFLAVGSLLGRMIVLGEGLSKGEIQHQIMLGILSHRLPPTGKYPFNNELPLEMPTSVGTTDSTTAPPSPPQELDTLPPLERPQGSFVVSKDISQWWLGEDCILGLSGEVKEAPQKEIPLLPREAAVLILHSHPYETYGDGGDIATEGLHGFAVEIPEDGGYPERGVVTLGERLTALFRLRGREVYHLTIAEDAGTSHLDTYEISQQKISEMLTRYPRIRMVLDLRRSAEMPEGDILRTQGFYQDESIAQIKISVDTNRDESVGLRDLDMAVLLRRGLYRKSQTLSAPVCLKQGAVLTESPQVVLLTVEIGAAGNTYEEALGAMRPLADALAQLWSP